MDTKTQLTKSTLEFMLYWKQYKKGLKKLGIKSKEWCITSDYCFDNPDKLDVATFTIFPYSVVKILLSTAKEKLAKDIKETKKFSPESISFLKELPLCFSISIIVNNLHAFFNPKVEILSIKQALSDYEQISSDKKTLESDVRYKRLKRFYLYTQQRSHSRKLLSQVYFVARAISQIMEFLLIKEGDNNIHWYSDRDKLMSFQDNIIMDLVNYYVDIHVKGRASHFRIALPSEINQNVDYPYDPLIRIPDIITGVMSSVELTDKGLVAQKIKHYDLFTNVIVDNPRIILLEFEVASNGVMGRRVFWKKPKITLPNTYTDG